MDVFHSARLLLIFAALDRMDKGSVAVDKLLHLEFFSAHPYLLFSPNDAEWADLVSVGFELSTVSYMSSSHRFISERERVKSYLVGLVSRGLVAVELVDGRICYRITVDGSKAATEIRSLYAKAHTVSANLVIRRLFKLNDKALSREARSRLRRGAVLLDL